MMGDPQPYSAFLKDIDHEIETKKKSKNVVPKIVELPKIESTNTQNISSARSIGKQIIQDIQ